MPKHDFVSLKYVSKQSRFHANTCKIFSIKTLVRFSICFNISGVKNKNKQLSTV